MGYAVCRVTSVAELDAATRSTDNAEIHVDGRLEGLPSLRLKPGQRLSGGADAHLGFQSGSDGVVLTADNAVEGLSLQTDPDRSAVRNDTDFAGFGRLRLERLRTVGCIRLMADGVAVGGHVEVDDLHVMQADARGFDARPSAFGVEVVPGAFTLWNRHTSSDRVVTAALRGISVGLAGLPVSGTGVLVGGTKDGGKMVASLLETGEVNSDGGITPGTADRIGGGVFVLQGAEIDEVRNVGPVTTYGANDMVLDNWGRVERWHALAKVSSHGPAGIGFVNLGALGTLRLDALLETHGLGACGFNCGEFKADAGEGLPVRGGIRVIDGAVREAIFERVVTRGDGAVGIQVAVAIGTVRVRGGIETFGGTGASLARGVVMQLPAVALSIKPGGAVRELVVDDGLMTHGAAIEAIELHGQIDKITISGSAGPAGGGF